MDEIRRQVSVDVFVIGGHVHDLLLVTELVETAQMAPSRMKEAEAVGEDPQSRVSSPSNGAATVLTKSPVAP